MYITWEDRKNYGTIDNNMLTTKPDLGFTYAWFLMNDHTAQYVESHGEGYFNELMSDEQKQAVLDFYNAWIPPAVVEPEPYVPTIEEIREGMVITPLQAKLQLHRVGLLDEVDDMVATDREVQLYWEFALEIRRTHPTLAVMAVGLGLTDEQLDELFVEAAKIS